jgi:hypothetical protein
VPAPQAPSQKAPESARAESFESPRAVAAALRPSRSHPRADSRLPSHLQLEVMNLKASESEPVSSSYSVLPPGGRPPAGRASTAALQFQRPGFRIRRASLESAGPALLSQSRSTVTSTVPGPGRGPNLLSERFAMMTRKMLRSKFRRVTGNLKFNRLRLTRSQ